MSTRAQDQMNMGVRISPQATGYLSPPNTQRPLYLSVSSQDPSVSFSVCLSTCLCTPPTCVSGFGLLALIKTVLGKFTK